MRTHVCECAFLSRLAVQRTYVQQVFAHSTNVCHKCLAVHAQMGGPEGVRAAERTSITLSSSEGMKVHALPRAAKA